MNKTIIAPSILAADFARLKEEVEMLNDSRADWLHIDIMDGVFVPNISYGIPVTEAIGKYARKPLDVHLMIVKPENYVEAFKNAGAEIITVHYEACPHLHRNIQQIKNLGCKAGVSVNPHTDVSLLEDILADIDLVLIMSVNPGFGGQKFIERTYHKISKLRDMAEKLNKNLIIEVDGGVTLENAGKLIDTGATALVAGSFVFNSTNPKDTIGKLKDVRG